ncbi:MAG TPA: UDP-N-acetylmuramoyl-L-alanine--D-glutamate ligase [candidate division Zixibacteria bacterium]|nr:UDP-N-acetylmuramoyl-L-alanine--D-glutamate ligase [candidate division Zixibacteria bacterium]
MTVREKITGRKIGIIGMGRSGIAAALLGSRLGGDVFVSESRSADSLTDQINQLAAHKIAFETGGHTERLLACDYIIISPGVPPTAPIVQQITSAGLPIFSEIEFASWVFNGRIVAITGSNGKTTTTTLIGEILKAAGMDAVACGNIGQPFADYADKLGDNGVAVVEISTFQLERIDQFRPDVALLLNLSPDHLDRHGTYEAYKKLKYRITENQTAKDALILNLEDSDSVADNVSTRAVKRFFTTKDDPTVAAYVQDDWLFVDIDGSPRRIIHRQDIGIPGPHNLQNSAAAALATSLMGVKPNVLNEVLRKFAGVEHRLEKVDRVAGIDFVNDSKATNVDSVCYALRSVDTPLYLIAGGRDKGGSYEPLIEHGRGKIKGVILIGESRQKMFDTLGKVFPTQFAESLEAAVRMAFDMASPGETVLLSPACASFDMFNSYEHRGKVFKQAVAGLRNGKKNEATAG